MPQDGELVCRGRFETDISAVELPAPSTAACRQLRRSQLLASYGAFFLERLSAHRTLQELVKTDAAAAVRLAGESGDDPWGLNG